MTMLPAALVDRLAVWNGLMALADQPLDLAPGLRLRLILPPAADPPPGLPRYRIATPQGPVALCLLELPMKALTGAEIALDRIAGLPPPLPGILLDGLAELLTALLPPEARTLVLGVTQDTAPPARAGPVEVLEIRLEANWGSPVRLLVAAPLAVLTGLAVSLGRGAVPPRLPAPLAVRIPALLRLTLSGPVLNLARLQRLEPGDALLVADARCLRLLAPGLVARLAPAPNAPNTPNAWLVEEIAVTPATDLPGPDPDATPATGPGDIPVHLSFVLDSRRATLAEVQELRPGAMLPMSGVAGPVPGLAVRVLANGREIGAGNLVEVDGQYAVRLTQLYGQGPA